MWWRRSGAPRRAAHQRRRGRLASCGLLLVVALGAEYLLEIVVVARQPCDCVAVGLAACDLQEVRNGAHQATCLGAVAGHGADRGHRSADERYRRSRPRRCRGCGRHGILGDRPVRCPARERRCTPGARPISARTRASAGVPPVFFVTRARLSATASSRFLSFSPEAARQRDHDYRPGFRRGSRMIRHISGALPQRGWGHRGVELYDTHFPRCSRSPHEPSLTARWCRVPPYAKQQTPAAERPSQQCAALFLSALRAA